MEEYTGTAELVDPRGNVVAEVLAGLTATPRTFTAMGEWGGELEATEAQPDPFMAVLGIDGLAVRIGDREGVVTIASCTHGGGGPGRRQRRSTFRTGLRSANPGGAS